MPLRGQGAPEVNLADESGVISIKREKAYFFLFSSALGSPNNDGPRPIIFLPMEKCKADLEKQTNRALMVCLNCLFGSHKS